ncbi:hypothetical protein [Bradyrhizobium sp. WSM2793]|uniref:hypothetical protein n=1 Tax=Bradyrhizobium sp. WSM2793 TaxID=1038866 RepID=UPI0003704B68|nr:hypothetical protein [Bradyrhizobium sp. WSM2793]
MSEQFETFEEIDEQTAFSVNVGSRTPRKWRAGLLSISPAMERAKVAREPKPSPAAPDSPAPAVSLPEAVPAKTTPTAAPIVRSMAGLVEALRQRRDELDISNETIDNIAGFPERYTSKLLAPRAPRNLSYHSLGQILGALGVGLRLVEDPEQVARVRRRWEKRKPQGPRYKPPLCVDERDGTAQTSSNLVNLEKADEHDAVFDRESSDRAEGSDHGAGGGGPAEAIRLGAPSPGGGGGEEPHGANDGSSVR